MQEMANAQFNPDDVGIPNGNYFALPKPQSRAALALLPVTWDATVSYRAGTCDGPRQILDASSQVDIYDINNGEVWRYGIETLEGDTEIARQNKQARCVAEQVIAKLEQGVSQSDESVRSLLDVVNAASAKLNEWVYGKTTTQLEQGKAVGIIGGDHSVPFGLIQALGERHSEFGILHIDAHADLREAYEGFEFSHASIMYNVLNRVKSVKRLVQVGIRDLGKGEMDLGVADPRIRLYDDYYLVEKLFNGTQWAKLCQAIVAQLPPKVYVSFDIDGLSPELCPNTGTPVPGGLTFHQANYLLAELVRQGKRILGFDLCEVASDEWDGIVGARILYKLCGYCIMSQCE